MANRLLRFVNDLEYGPYGHTCPGCGNYEDQPHEDNCRWVELRKFVERMLDGRVYVVVYEFGTYDDHELEIIRVFDNEDDAAAFAKQKNEATTPANGHYYEEYSVHKATKRGDDDGDQT